MIKIIFYTCKNCQFLWTGNCPIRVWGRNEERQEILVWTDVNIHKDFCSRFKKGNNKEIIRKWLTTK